MTVAVNDTIERYVIAGVGPYAYTWRIFNETDLAVVALSPAVPPLVVPLTYLTHYTVSGANESAGGSITLTAAAYPAYAGYTLDIRSNTPRSQPTSIRNQARFLPEIHEDAFDRLDRQIQDTGRLVDASLRSPDNEPALAMVLPPVATRANKFSAFDSLGQPIASSGTGADAGLRTDLANGAGGLGSNLVAIPRTATEILAAAAPTNYVRTPSPMDPRRYGADDTGAADSASAINAAIGALNAGSIKGGRVSLIGDNNTNYLLSSAVVFPSRPSGVNETRSYSFSGSGRMGPRLKAGAALANGTMVNMAGQDSSTYSFYRQINNLYLDAQAIAQKGIDIRFNQHFEIESVFITGLVNGTGTAAGVEVFGAICAAFRDIKVHNCQGHGLYASGGSTNFFNANDVHGCSILAVTGSGFNFTGGCAGCDLAGNTLESCGEYGMRFAGYSGGGTHVHGNYLESNVLGDFLIGETTSQEDCTFEANYCNGYTAGVGDTTYTPFKVKFANNIRIVGNQVAVTPKSPTGFLILDANLAGGTVSNCVVKDNAVMDLDPSTAPSSLYNLPGAWVDNGNELTDATFAPLIESNLIRRGWAAAGWTKSVSGTGSTAVSSARPLMGATSIRLVRPAASTAVASQVFALEAGSPYKNRFVTLAIPIRDNVGSKSIVVSLVPNGTAPISINLNVQTIALNAERIVYAMAFVPADATQLSVQFAANVDGSDFDLGMPCLYVGAKQWYSAASEGDTSGTWTPVIGGATSETGQAYSSQIGRYSRIGNLVFCSFDVALSTKGAITGAVVLKGLPFVGLTSGLAGLPGVTFGFFNGLTTSEIALYGYVEGNNSRCFLQGLAAAAVTPAGLVAADLSNTARFAGSFVYVIDQP